MLTIHKGSISRVTAIFNTLLLHVSMSFATAGMTRGVRSHLPVASQAFQDLGEQKETRANSLATLQKLAAARPMTRPNSFSTNSPWSNSGLVDLNAHSTKLSSTFDTSSTPYMGNRYSMNAPQTPRMGRSYTNFDSNHFDTFNARSKAGNIMNNEDSVVYVSNVEAPASASAKQIVQQFVNTIPSENENTNTKQSAAAKTATQKLKVPMQPNDITTNTGIAKIEKKMLNTDQDVQRLSTHIAKISKALDIMTDQQKATDDALKKTQSDHHALQMKNKSITEQNSKLSKENERMSAKIAHLEAQNKENTKKLLFKNLTEKNKK